MKSTKNSLLNIKSLYKISHTHLARKCRLKDTVNKVFHFDIIPLSFVKYSLKVTLKCKNSFSNLEQAKSGLCSTKILVFKVY